LVQEQLNFKDGSALRLTVARYYTPTGRCIQRSYKDGLDTYNNDYMHRFLDGELENPDSIKFPDSLKYKTPGGKTVYGGGGIMPDLYIPIENDSSLRYYNICVNKGLVYQWAFDYTDRNRAHLQQYKDIDRFDRTFSINDGLYQEFIRYTETKGVKRPKGNLQKSDHYLRTLIKAYIARNILDNEGFYPILNTIDPAIQKAIEEANR
jgi:carboxyl-terminal processing protease